MLYQAYQAHSDVMGPVRFMAQAANDMLQQPWLGSNFFTRSMGAFCEMLARAGMSHSRPPFGIDRVKVAGKEAAEGVYVHLPIDTSLPDTAAYVARFKAKYGANMNGFSPFFYAGLQMLFTAMQKAGTVEDTTKIAATLEGLSDVPTAMGRAGWTGEKQYGIKHQIDLPFYVGQIKDGVVTKVATCDVNACK